MPQCRDVGYESHEELMKKPDGQYRRLLEVQIGLGEIAEAAE